MADNPQKLDPESGEHRPNLNFEGDSFHEFVCRDVSKDAGYKRSPPLAPRLYIPEPGQERPAS